MADANTSSIYDELAMQDADFAGEVDDGVDVTGESLVHLVSTHLDTCTVVDLLRALSRYTATIL